MKICVENEKKNSYDSLTMKNSCAIMHLQSKKEGGNGIGNAIKFSK